MPPFVTHEGKEFYHLALRKAADFALPFPPTPYVCLVWDHGAEWSTEERSALTTAVVASDCRYAVCGGTGCERWHDDFDETFLGLVPEAEQEERFLMTTWHTDEPPLEVAWFFAWNTYSDTEPFTRFLVLELGTASQPATVLEPVVRRAVLECDAVIDELEAGAG